MAIASTLEFNTFFRGFKASHMRLSGETLERLLHVLKRSIWLEELYLEGLGLKYELMEIFTFEFTLIINAFTFYFLGPILYTN